jgi:hypothetical protein
MSLIQDSKIISKTTTEQIGTCLQEWVFEGSWAIEQQEIEYSESFVPIIE